MQCSSEAVKNLRKVCTACILYIYWNRIFSCVSKIKRGMLAVSSVTTPLRVYTLRIYGAIILVLAINSLKMKQMVDFFLFCSSRAVAS